MSDQTKMEQLRSRLKEGAVLRTCESENGYYVVHLTKDPPIEFEESNKEIVNRILHELNQI